MRLKYLTFDIHFEDFYGLVNVDIMLFEKSK